jgi:hypothetical protein
LRIILAPVEKKYRIRCNNELHKPPEDPSMSNTTKLIILHRADRIQLMGGKRIPKRIQGSNNTGKRLVGETRKRWV